MTSGAAQRSSWSERGRGRERIFPFYFRSRERGPVEMNNTEYLTPTVIPTGPDLCAAGPTYVCAAYRARTVY